jgi:glycosyltransferase involved in cell wall biosynthesis
MTNFVDFARTYSLPTRDPHQTRPRAGRVSSAQLLRARVHRLTHRGTRRLAYLDSTFPWLRSGFRYHEASALLELVPDTVFFSHWDMTDPFPVPVHSLADFPKVASREGITDAYGVFQLFLAGLVGLSPSHPQPPHVMEGPDLSEFLRKAGIRLHGSIYPGGGFTNTESGLVQARALASRLSTTFSYVPEVLANVPGVTPVDQAFTETRFYTPTYTRWQDMEKLICLFAADSPPRKGADIALGAFEGLPADSFHLHVVGPHEHRRGELPADIATFHGWLSPGELRDLHRRAHVFISPVSAEPPGPTGSFAGVTDGFPTQAAADAMSSGCLLVSSNPAADYRVLEPAVHYLECEADVIALREVLAGLALDLPQMKAIAQAGSEQVRGHMDVRRGMRFKLLEMGFLLPNGDRDAEAS